MLAHMIFMKETIITPLIKNIIISSTVKFLGLPIPVMKKLSGMLIIAIKPRKIN